MSASALTHLDADGRAPLHGQLVVPVDGVDLVEVVDPNTLAAQAAIVAASQAAPKTREAYGRTYRQLAALAGPGAGVEALTAELVVRYRNDLERRGRAPSTIARELAAVRVLVRALNGPSAALQVKGPKVPKGEPRPLTDGQLARLLAAPDLRTSIGVRDRAILEVMARAGARREEVTALDVDSIQLRARHADGRLRPAIEDSTAWALAIEDGKGGSSHDVPIGEPLFEALRAWQGRRPTAATTALFVSLPRPGRPAARLSVRQIGRIVAQYAEAAELPSDVGPHTLRHTFGSRLGRANVPLDVIAALLGHGDIRSALVYVDRGRAAQADAIALVERQPSGLDQLAAAAP